MWKNELEPGWLFKDLNIAERQSKIYDWLRVCRNLEDLDKVVEFLETLKDDK